MEFQDYWDIRIDELEAKGCSPALMNFLFLEAKASWEESGKQLMKLINRAFQSNVWRS
jgi:hypothetical protein